MAGEKGGRLEVPGTMAGATGERHNSSRDGQPEIWSRAVLPNALEVEVSGSRELFVSSIGRGSETRESGAVQCIRKGSTSSRGLRYDSSL